MAKVRVNAEYVYTLESHEPLKRGYVEYDDADGSIISTGLCAADEDGYRGPAVQLCCGREPHAGL